MIPARIFDTTRPGTLLGVSATDEGGIALTIHLPGGMAVALLSPGVAAEFTAALCRTVPATQLASALSALRKSDAFTATQEART